MQEISGDKSFKLLDQDIYILFYFGASWCKPCQIILPLMDNLIQKYDKNIIQFYKIDIDLEENNILCDKCKIKVVPAFLLFKGMLLFLWYTSIFMFVCVFFRNSLHRYGEKLPHWCH